jgi:hypothetical protein
MTVARMRARARARMCCVCVVCVCLTCVGFCVCAASSCHLSRASPDDQGSSAVDLYNSVSGTWSTAQLSVARLILAAASVGNVAIFAGGYTGSVLLWIDSVTMSCGSDGCARACVYLCVFLSLVCGLRLGVACFCAVSACRLIRATAGAKMNIVDLYNSESGAWTTAQLSVARDHLAATSVGNMAIFAGGALGNSVAVD